MFRVHHLIFALEPSFLIPWADDCAHVDVPAQYQMCNAFPGRGINRGTSGQDLCAELPVHLAGTLHSLGLLPWAKLEPANLAHRNGVADSGGM